MPFIVTTRIQRSRVKGYRLPAGAIYVGRPTRWGNPFPVEGDWIVWTSAALGFRADGAGRRAASLALHRWWLTGAPYEKPLAAVTASEAITFADGRTIDTATHCRHLAQAFAYLTATSLALPAPPTRDDIRAALRGHDLACWCAPDSPCHADLLLEIANGT